MLRKECAYDNKLVLLIPRDVILTCITTVVIPRTPARETRNEWSFQKNGYGLKPKEALTFIQLKNGSDAVPTLIVPD